MTPMIDIVLESMRAILTGLTLLFLVTRPEVKVIRRNKGWHFFVIGFALIFLGTLVDITDNFGSLNRFIVIGDTPYQAFIEKVIGFFLGFIFLALGVWLGIPAIIENDRCNRKQIEINREKLKTQKATMRTVLDIVGNAFQELQLLTIEAKKKAVLETDSIDKINETIFRTSDKLTKIANLKSISEKHMSHGLMMLDVDTADKDR